MRKLTLGSPQSLRDLLRSALRKSDEQRMLHRLHCALLVAEGRSCYEVARWFGENPRTVERWVHALEAQGAEGLKDHHAGGRPTKLSVELLQRLALDLQKPPRLSGYPMRTWSGKLLTQLLHDRYGVRLSSRQCQRLLRRLARTGPLQLACLFSALAAAALAEV